MEQKELLSREEAEKFEKLFKKSAYYNQIIREGEILDKRIAKFDGKKGYEERVKKYKAKKAEIVLRLALYKKNKLAEYVQSLPPIQEDLIDIKEIMSKEDAKTLTINADALVFLCDMIESSVMDVNNLIEKYEKDTAIIMFDKLTNALK